MSNYFSSRSLNNLATVHPILREILYEALEVMDFVVLCGYRDEKAQNEAYENGTSKLQYPNSVHNTQPSRAVDVAPYRIDWDDTLAFARLAGIIECLASQRGYRIRWGGDWDGDHRSNDQTFNDLGHFELTI